MTPERIRELAMETLAKQLEKQADPTAFPIPTNELLEIIERLAPPKQDCPPTPQWQPMSTAPKDGRWVLLRRCRDMQPADNAPYRALMALRWFDEPADWRVSRWADTGWHSMGFDGWLPIPGEDGPR